MTLGDGSGKPEKIRLDEILGEAAAPPGGSEDGSIEVEDGSTARRSEPGDGTETPSEGASETGESGLLLEEALKERDSYRDLCLRARADLENFRRRVERDRDEDRARAAGAVALEILPSIDNLDRALGQGGDPASFREGVELIRRQLDDALRKIGIEPIESLGEEFDPACHEALTAEVRPGFRPNTVIEEVRRGYRLGGRVLRPSLVKVVLAPPAAAPAGPPPGAGGEEESDGPHHRD